MKNTRAMSFGAALAIMAILLPAAVSAATFPYWGPSILSCTGDGSGGLPPCTSLCQLLETGQNFIFLIATLAVFVVAPVMLVWGGIMILIAGANPGGIQTGKNIIVGTIVGMAIALGAFLIVNFIMDIVAEANGGERPAGVSWPSFACTPGDNAPEAIEVDFKKN
jgi:hypothetical protein